MLDPIERNKQIREKKKQGILNSLIMKEYKISYVTLRAILDEAKGE